MSKPKGGTFQGVLRPLTFIAQSFGIAIGMLRMHKLRAALTMLGVIIGVFSVTIIIMASEAFQYYMSNQIEKLGADTIIVMYDPGGMGRGRTVGGIEGLKNEDVEYLTNRVSSIDVASPLSAEY